MEEDFERFSIYGFSIDYPKDCRLEFNPKSRRGAGDVVFHFPDKVKIFLSWGDLEKAAKSFHTVEEHADHSLNAVKKAGNVKKFERVSRDTLSLHSHKGVYSRVRLEEMTVGFFSGRKSVPRDAYSVHVHCQDSSRFFVIYALVSGGTEDGYEKTLMTMANSLNCH